jgi:hypothetical protein
MSLLCALQDSFALIEYIMQRPAGHLRDYSD